MILFKYIKNISILFLMLSSACTNTRVILEGTKKVINHTSKEQNEITENKNLLQGHYKVGNPYKINGIRYVPKLVSEYDETGIASWYGPKFNLKKTANGEIFDQDKISAAHKTLPLPSIVKVTHLKNNNTIFLRVNDRGPFVNDRIIDFSKKAAIKFGFYRTGIAHVRVELIDTGPHLLDEKYLNYFYLENYAKNIDSKKTEGVTKKFKLLLQIGAFEDKKNALDLLTFLKTKIDDNLFIKDAIILENKLIYKLFAGPYKEEKIAKASEQKLRDLGFSAIYKKE